MLSILFPTTATISRRVSNRFLLHWLMCLLCFAPVSVWSLSPTEPAKSVSDRDRQVFRVVQEFMIDVRKGSLARAYQTLTSQDFRETTSLSHLVAFVSQYPSLRRNRSVDLIKIQYHENVASINVELTSTEHENEVALFSVRYDEGRWRIISIQIFPPPPK